jgi:hypothetical protein
MPAPLLQPTDFSAPGMIDATTAQAAEGRALDIGVNAAQSVSDTLFQRLADRASTTGKLAGLQAGSRIDPQTGELLPIENLPPLTDMTAYGQAYRAAALQTYANTATLQADKQASEIAARHFADPAGFDTEYNAYKSQTIKSVGQGTGGMAIGLIMPDLINIGNTHHTELYRQNVDLTIKNNATAFQQWDAVNSAHAQEQIRQTALETPGQAISQDDLANKAGKFNDTIKAFTDPYNTMIDHMVANNPNIYTKEWGEGEKLNFEKLLWGSAIRNQAAAFGTVKRSVDGKPAPDEDGMNKYLLSLPGVPAGLFNDTELATIRGEAANQFNTVAGTQKQTWSDQNTQANANLRQVYSTDQMQGQKLFDTYKNLPTPDNRAALTNYLATINNKDAKSYSTNQLEGQTLKDGIVKGITKDLNDFDTNLKNSNFAHNYSNAMAPNVNSKTPNTVPDEPGDEKTVAMLNHTWNTKVQADLNNPTAKNDIFLAPGEFYAANIDGTTGFTWHATGRIADDVAASLNKFQPGDHTPQELNNAVTNFNAMMTADPRLADAVRKNAPDGLRNMQIWASVKDSKDPIGLYNNILSSNDGWMKYQTEKQRTAASVAHDYFADADKGLNNGFDTLNKTIAGSETEAGWLSAELTRLTGQNVSIGAKSVPPSMRRGIFGEILDVLHVPAGVTHFLGFAPGSNAHIAVDSDIVREFQADHVDGMLNGDMSKPDAANAALGTLNRNNVYLSRLTQNDALMQLDPDERKSSLTLTKYGIEGYTGLPTSTILENLSLKYRQQAADFFAKNPDNKPFGFMRTNMYPPGSPLFLNSQGNAGNVHVDPVGVVTMADGVKRMGYNVNLIYQDKDGHEHVQQLNDHGDYYYYDPAGGPDRDVRLQAAKAGAAAARRVQDQGPYFGNSIYAAISANRTAAQIESDAMDKQIDDANQQWLKTEGKSLSDFATTVPVGPMPGTVGTETPP